MNQHVTSFIRDIQPVDLRCHGGLQAVRLFRGSGASSPAPVPALRLALAPLTAAVASGAAVVSEVGGGEVGRLQVTNRGGALLFGMSGEIVVGGRQDRVLNSSVLIAPGASATVRVSCVERDRWEEAGACRNFRDAEVAATPSVRSAVHGTVVTSVRQTGVHMADQQKVWRHVSGTLRRTGVTQAVPTGTLAGGLQHHRGRIDAYARVCAEVDPGLAQLGLALFTPGTPGAGLHGLASIDCFGAPDLLSHYASRLVRGAAMEASDSAPETMVPAADATRQLLAVLADQRATVMSAAAGDTPDAHELHYTLDGMVASVLCYREQPVHLAISPVEQPAPIDDGVDSNGYRVSRPRGGTRIHAAYVPVTPPPQQVAAPIQPVTVNNTSASAVAMVQIQLPDAPPRFLQLQPGAYVIGRGSDSDIQLDDETISRDHARLDISINRAAIADLNSTNGVAVNDEPVLLSQLHHGDHIALGRNIHLQFLRPSEQ